MFLDPKPSAAAEFSLLDRFWALELADLLRELNATEQGLTTAEARAILARVGKNQLRAEHQFSRLRVIRNQLANPLLWLLVFAAGVSGVMGEWTDSVIVGAIVLATTFVGYSREYSAQAAVLALRSRTRTQCTVLRDGRNSIIAADELVPGDIVLLGAGRLVPADGVLLEATDCFVSEAALTGESFPVPKQIGRVAADAPLGKRTNCVFMGTNVRSGSARCLVVKTGPQTQFGGIAERLTLRPPETEFERGTRRFGYLLTSAMLALVLMVFVAHMLMHRPPAETLLFSIALAVGLSPELLPAILSINLARGAANMARSGVIVKRLPAIENLGSMDVLCTDKTGTLTAGVIEMAGTYASNGEPSEEVLRLSAINAHFETGLPSPLDDAILAAFKPDLTTIQKRAEVPFDFMRKRVSVVVADGAQLRLITKGAFHHVLEICASVTVLGASSASNQAQVLPLDATGRAALEQRYATWSEQGIRVVAVASKSVADQSRYGREDEAELTFVGFLTFLDRPKDGVKEALQALNELGVQVKMITGDSKLVAMYVAAQVGLKAPRILTGAEMLALHDEALWREAERTDVFAEVDPNQKERIILSLKKMGHVVGFLGDGVNDAPAMHAADTSLSVDQAVDVAKESADFVLLERDLDVIRRGIEEGRRTFANTHKYVLTTTSANLGNMLSMALTSLFLPYLPLLAGQILLNNFLSDIPAVGIADDSVDPELVMRPQRWDMRLIGRFMFEFGLLSSFFDFVTFGTLLVIFRAEPETFRTGWFVESLLTELLIALVVRTRRPFFRSRPGKVLLWSTQALIAFTLALPYLPYAERLGLVPLPPLLLGCLILIGALYVLAAEITKHWFFRADRVRV